MDGGGIDGGGACGGGAEYCGGGWYDWPPSPDGGLVGSVTVEPPSIDSRHHSGNPQRPGGLPGQFDDQCGGPDDSSPTVRIGTRHHRATTGTGVPWTNTDTATTTKITR